MSEENKNKSIIESFVSGELGLVEGITGILASKKEDVVLALGHSVQGLIKFEFFEEFLKEWNKMRDKGKIKVDYQQSEQFKELFSELLDLLERENSNKEKLKLLKKIFIVAGMEKETDRESVLPLEYLKLGSKLSSGEILILISSYKIAKEDKYQKTPFAGADEWLKAIASDSKLKLKSLVESHEATLIEKQLLTKRENADNSGVRLQPHYRLTDFGYEFCKYVNQYE